MKTRIVILNIVLIIFIVVGLGYLSRFRIVEVWEQWMADPLPPAITYDQIRDEQPVDQSSDEPVNVIVDEPSAIPVEFNLDVPFTTQAPHADWKLPYKEACEEASAITVHYFFQNDTFTVETADKEILDLVAWEEANLGFYKDTTAEETAQFMKDYWGYQRVDVLYNPTVNDIKTHIAAGRPVIVPAAGQQLGNPNFTEPGPLYHMFVVRGYTADTFITNDVGTKNGENYVYDIEVVMDAMHDWNDGDVTNGKKVVVVAYPNE